MNFILEKIQFCFFLLKIKDTWNSPVRGDSLINPFSRGNMWLNCFATLCGPLPPSCLNLRAIVKEETQIPDNNLSETIRYHPEENGVPNNRVV